MKSSVGRGHFRGGLVPPVCRRCSDTCIATSRARAGGPTAGSRSTARPTRPSLRSTHGFQCRVRASAGALRAERGRDGCLLVRRQRRLTSCNLACRSTTRRLYANEPAYARRGPRFVQLSVGRHCRSCHHRWRSACVQPALLPLRCWRERGFCRYIHGLRAWTRIACDR